MFGIAPLQVLERESTFFAGDKVILGKVDERNGDEGWMLWQCLRRSLLGLLQMGQLATTTPVGTLPV